MPAARTLLHFIAAHGAVQPFLHTESEQSDISCVILNPCQVPLHIIATGRIKARVEKQPHVQ